ncbi:hypothetical protein KCP75_21650 [Salmonella enterica subsp. enterica]|nr:hypothetical protein KCP75_21650 [Salmonella enterica subsp. enterica]
MPDSFRGAIQQKSGDGGRYQPVDSWVAVIFRRCGRFNKHAFRVFYRRY